MSDLKYDVGVSGLPDLDHLLASLEKLDRVLVSSKGSGKALEQTARIINGMKGQAPIFQQLAASVQGLEKAATSLSTNISNDMRLVSATLNRELKMMTATIATELRTLSTTGLNSGKQLGQGVAEGISSQEGEVLRRARSMSARVRAEMAKASSPVTGQVSTAASGAAASGLDPQVLARTRKEADLLSGSFSKLAVSGNDVHSMSRGLASGFNLLWLTWGNLVPLFIGATISNGFMKTARDGMQVAHTLEIIAALGENTASEMKALTAEMIDLGYSGIRGPKELTEAFKVLSLAGLKANEVLAVTGTVMNFSVAGTTDIETAADVLVSVTTAFGTGAAGFERSADLIARAAADSKASVESFGEAMKTASVVGEQYGARQEDVALQIQYLAQLGIQGSAAGTAIRNMYADITGRSGQVSKILKSFGLDFKDAEGNVVSLREQMQMLDGVLRQYDAKSQGNIIQAIYGERGAKAAIADLQAFRTAASDSSKYANKLEEDLARIGAAAGDSAINAAKLAQTTANLFKSVGASFETTLYQAYEAIEPQLYAIGTAMREAFSSPEAVEGVKAMVSIIANLGVVVADSLPILVKVGVVWASYRVAVALASTALAAADTALRQNIASKIASASATTAAAAAEANYAKAATAAGASHALAASNAVKGFAGLARVLPIVGNAVSLGIVGWSLYDAWMGRASATADTYANDKSKNILEALRKENEHIEAVNKLRAEGIALVEAEARVKAGNALSEANRSGLMAGADTAKELAKAEQELESLLSRHAPEARLKAENTLYAKQSQHVQDLRNKLADVQSEQALIAIGLEAEEKKRRKNAEDSAKFAEAEAARLRESMKLQGGTQSWNLADFQGAGKDRIRERAQLDRDNELKAIQAQSDAIVSLETDTYNRRKKIMDARRSGELISEEQYMVDSFNLATSYEQQQVANLVAGTEKYLAVYAERQQRLREAMNNAAKDETKAVYAEAIEREQNDAAAYIAAQTAKIEKTKAEAAERIELSYITLEAAAGKLAKTDKEFWEARDRETTREKEAIALEKAYDNINTSVFSTDTALKAAAKAQRQVNKEVDEHVAKLRTALKHWENILEAQKQSLIDLGDLPGVGENELRLIEQQIKRTEGVISKIRENISDATSKGMQEGLEQASIAFEQARYQQLLGLRDSLTQITLEGITGSGKEAGRRLRNLLQQELLMKPLTVMLNGVFGSIVGSLFGGGGSALQALTGGGAGGIGGLSNLFSAGSSLYDMVSTGFSSAISSGFSTFALSPAGQSLGLSAMGAGGMGPPALTSAGSAIGTAMPYLAGAGIGYGLGSMISGGYSAIGKGGYAANIGGTAIGMILGGPIGAIIGGALGGVVNRLFGRKLKDWGIEGTLGGEAGFEGREYEFYKGGLFRSDKTKYKELDEDVRKGIADSYKAIQAQVGTFATVLGLETDKIADFTSAFKFSTKDLDDEGIQEAFAQALRTGSNELAQQLIGSWQEISVEEVNRQMLGRDFSDVLQMQSSGALDKPQLQYVASEFARDGEEAIDTLTRLATSLTAANNLFDMLGTTLYEASLAGGDMASQLADLFGGVEEMGKAAGVYFQNFYSADEQREYARRMIEGQLQALDLTLPDIDADDARQQWRALAEAQDRTTESGRKAWAVIMQLSGAFAEITQTAEQAAEEVKRRQEEAERLAYDNFRKAVDRDRKLLQDQASAIQKVIDTLRGAVDMLKDNARDLYQSVDDTAKMLADEGVAYIKDALGGVRAGKSLADYDKLKEAVDAARAGLSGQVYATQFEKERDALILAGRLSELAEKGEGQLDVQERQLRVINEQLEYLELLSKRADDLVNGSAELNLTVKESFSQLLALYGAKAENKPVTDAQGNGPSWGGGTGTAPIPAPSTGSSYSRVRGFGSDVWYEPITDKGLISRLDKLAPVYHSFDGTGNLVGLAEAFKDVGGTIADLSILSGYFEKDWRQSFAAVGVPAFATGTNYVPHDMLAQLHEGEQIIPKKYNPWAGGSGATIENLISEVVALREELARVVAATEATAAGVELLPQMIEQFDDVTEGGNALRTVVMPDDTIS